MARKSSELLYIEAVIRLAAVTGIENLRTKTVAAEVGFSEAAMFRHFEGKDDLLCQTFLYVDKKVSSLLTDSSVLADLEKNDFLEIVYALWEKIYRYLLDNPEETLYLIRFRYSALYSEEIRSQRQAYNGSFDRFFDYVAGRYGLKDDSYRGFLINYVFELTLSFAEKVVTGRFKDNDVTKARLWKAISGAVNGFLTDPSI